VPGNLSRRLPVIAVVIVVAGVLAASVGGSPAGERPRRTGAAVIPAETSGSTPAGATPSTSTSSTVAVASLPPPLGWSSCGSGYQCSTLVVPRDYGDPGGPHIGIALERRPASLASRRIGSLVINPGGPGESGIGNFVKDLSILPAGVLARFDIVTFDPRGVGASEGIHCTGDTYSGPEPDPVPQTPGAEQALLAADRAYAASCARAAGALLAHVGTEDVARDLEQLRLALGDPGLTYLGLSYGTLIGETYAAMFPTRVRAMVLDGPLDPSLTTTELANAQATGFQGSLDRFFAWCRSSPGACAWRPGGDPHAAFEAIVAAVRSHPLAVGRRSVRPTELYTGAFGSLYSTAFWPSLGRALAGVAAGDGTAMLSLYDSYQRLGDPTFDGDANNAVTCLDHPVPADPAAYPGLAAAAARVAPDFGPLFAWGTLSCAVWPVPPSAERTPAAVNAIGSPPILVVGTTGDPATPYVWARSVAASLSHAILLTREGLDHVALFTSSCVRAYDEAYLVSLDPPAPGAVCPS